MNAPGPESIVFLGGVAAVGAIVAVLAVFAPSGLGPREASMYGLMLAITTQGAALGATVLNRVAITIVESLSKGLLDAVPIESENVNGIRPAGCTCTTLRLCNSIPTPTRLSMRRH